MNRKLAIVGLALSLAAVCAVLFPGGRPSSAGGYYIGNTADGRLIRLDLLVCDDLLCGTFAFEQTDRDFELCGRAEKSGRVVLTSLGPDEPAEARLELPSSPDFTRRELSGQWYDRTGRMDLTAGQLARYLSEKASGMKWSATCVFPEFAGNKHWTRAINSEIRQAVRATRQEFVSGVRETANWRKVAANRLKGGASIPTSDAILHDDWWVSLVSESVISVMQETYSHCWGAHGGTAHQGWNWQVRGGKAVRLALPDLFRPGDGFVKVLSDECIGRLREMDAEYAKAPEPKPFSREDMSCFCLTPDGLVIVFEEYSVDCYAAGFFLVTVPYSRLRSVIDPAGPLGPVMANARSPDSFQARPFRDWLKREE